MKRTHTVVRERPVVYDASIENTAYVYGRTLRWRTNDERDAFALGRLVERWKSVEVPFLGGYVSATAIRVRLPQDPLEVAGHLMSGGVLLAAGNASFSFLASDQKSVTTVLSDDLDPDFAVERLIEPIWFGLFTKPPLYGLHAGAAVRNNRATLFLGDHEAGKSTLVAGLARFAGFDYLGDDVVLLDGRDLRLYGRPWRVELREASWQEILPPEIANRGRAHHAKRYWDGRVAFEGHTVSSARAGRLCFVERGERFTVSPLRPAETRRRLGSPIPMFGMRRAMLGFRPVFDRLCSSVPGYVLTFNPAEGIVRTVSAVAEWLSREESRV